MHGTHIPTSITHTYYAWYILYPPPLHISVAGQHTHTHTRTRSRPSAGAVAKAHGRLGTRVALCADALARWGGRLGISRAWGYHACTRPCAAGCIPRERCLDGVVLVAHASVGAADDGRRGIGRAWYQVALTVAGDRQRQPSAELVPWRAYALSAVKGGTGK